MRKTALLSLLAALLGLGAMMPPPAAPPPAPAPAPALAPTARQAFDRINALRVSLGRKECVWSLAFVTPAQQHAEAMAQARQINHDGFLGRLHSTGFLSGAENVAFGQSTPDELVRAWSADAAHYQNVTSAAYVFGGVGVTRGSDGLLYWGLLVGGPQ